MKRKGRVWGFYVGEYCRSMREREGFDFMSTEGSMRRLLKVSNCPPSPSFPSPPPFTIPRRTIFLPSLDTSSSMYIYICSPSSSFPPPISDQITLHMIMDDSSVLVPAMSPLLAFHFHDLALPLTCILQSHIC